jgi:hypothetical protein
MVDNVAITAGAGTTVAADDISSVFYQRVKLALGADGVANDAEAGAGAVDTGTMRVTLASDDPAVAKLGTIDTDTGNMDTKLGTIDTDTGVIAGDTTEIATRLAAAYETVAAAQTAQVLGGTGATGDYLAGVLVVPATTSPGNVIILDNAVSITIFTGGASSVSNLVPFMIPVGAVSVSGAWKVTTGSNVSVVAIGNFSA